MSDPTASRAVHVTVTGRVQGVWFRAWTAEQATALGLAGWVRNCPDGSVEACLEGAPDKVAVMLGRLWQGPELARVDSVTPQDIAPQGFARFEIRRD